MCSKLCRRRSSRFISYRIASVALSRRRFPAAGAVPANDFIRRFEPDKTRFVKESYVRNRKSIQPFFRRQMQNPTYNVPRTRDTRPRLPEQQPKFIGTSYRVYSRKRKRSFAKPCFSFQARFASIQYIGIRSKEV